MHWNEAQRFLTREQAAYMGKLSGIARQARLLAKADHAKHPIRSGMQFGFLLWDTRTPKYRYEFGMLLDVGKHNRYELILNLERQSGLIGWHDAIRQSTKTFRPMIHPSQMEY